MKEELQTKLVEILGSIQTAAGKAGDFAIAQLPDIAQQYVVYGRISSLVLLVLCGIVAAAFSYVALRYGWGNQEAVVKKESWSIFNGDWLGHRIAAAWLGSIGAVLFWGATFANLSTAMLVWFAPKVWLLKEIASLIK